ncbi:MAG: hypothetical protein VX527_11165 [Planctomycetota bacterium]|nr:hypothetical protein [Planctomycetota bacterium]
MPDQEQINERLPAASTGSSPSGSNASPESSAKIKQIFWGCLWILCALVVLDILWLRIIF